MTLRVNGFAVGIAQLAHDFLILEESIDHPPSDAEIELSIDGRIKRWPVSLPNGLSLDTNRTPIAALGEKTAVATQPEICR